MKIRDLRRTAAEARRALAIGLKVQRAETEVMALTGCSHQDAAAGVAIHLDRALTGAVETAKRSARD